MIAGSLTGLAVMLIIWFALGAAEGGAAIGSVLLNMAVFGAMFSYIMQAISFSLSSKFESSSSSFIAFDRFSLFIIPPIFSQSPKVTF